jgi:hypothetical protein
MYVIHVFVIKRKKTGAWRCACFDALLLILKINTEFVFKFCSLLLLVGQVIQICIELFEGQLLWLQTRTTATAFDVFNFETVMSGAMQRVQ